MMGLGFLVLLSLVSYNPTEEMTFPHDQKSNNYLGYFGIYVSHILIKYTFGVGAFCFPIILGVVGGGLFSNKPFRFLIHQCSYFFGAGLWLGIFNWTILLFKESDISNFTHAGLFSSMLGKFIYDFVGGLGLFIIISTSLVFIISGYFNYSVKDGLVIFKKFILNLFNIIIIKLKEYKKAKVFGVDPEIKIAEKEELTSNSEESLNDKIEEELEGKEDSLLEINRHEQKDQEQLNINEITEEIDTEEIEISEITQVEQGDLDSEAERRARFLQYKLPTLNLLYNPPEIREDMSEEILNDKAKELEHALETFNVHGRVLRISPGPVITLFEVEPSEGVRVNKFVNLADDLARIMKAQRVRIIAPIPGSKTVGIELPNINPAIVFIRNILNSRKYIEAESKLTLAIGRTTKGEAFTFDLAKMPHLLIAGATGAGKSVCINTVVISILYKARPDEVKFIMIDPKRIELSTYRELVGYHLITSPNIEEYVMTTPENAVAVLHAALSEMERRYDVFSKATVRNLGEYHNKCKSNPNLEKMPFIVVLIDELADLMQTSGREIEDPIARLAQMARAVGIHLIVATQRPSVDVITGVIKANFPARIAFQVSSKVDSRTIIDQMGAEKLLGRGDMLLLPPGQSTPIRLHNAYITLEEIEKIMNHITSQPRPEEVRLPEIVKKSDSPEINFGQDRDELLSDAARLVIQIDQASVSLLQRRFRIGYSRAGRLIDELESLGIISGYSGSKARDVLVDESYLEQVGL